MNNYISVLFVLLITNCTQQPVYVTGYEHSCACLDKNDESLTKYNSEVKKIKANNHSSIEEHNLIHQAAEQNCPEKLCVYFVNMNNIQFDVRPCECLEDTKGPAFEKCKERMHMNSSGQQN